MARDSSIRLFIFGSVERLLQLAVMSLPLCNFSTLPGGKLISSCKRRGCFTLHLYEKGLRGPTLAGRLGGLRLNKRLFNLKHQRESGGIGGWWSLQLG